MIEDMLAREAALCTHPYATVSSKSKGRVYPLENDGYRTEFQRDIHRVIYCRPFRRLRHKTQVFYFPLNDHVCTRLEHVHHVASCARTVARTLKLNEDLVEAIALGHDLGHAPFGHHGEEFLTKLYKECTGDTKWKFQHEVNSLRVVDKLAQWDKRGPAGLNLSWEVRDGIVSHCGESLEDLDYSRISPHTSQKILGDIRLKTDAGMPCTLEGCVVRLADVFAYVGRDLEDGIQAGLVEREDIPSYVKQILGEDNGTIVKNLITDLIDSSPINDNYLAMSEEKFKAIVALKEFNTSNIYKRKELHMYKRKLENMMMSIFQVLFLVLEDTRCFTKKSGFPRRLSCLAVLKEFVNDIQYTYVGHDEKAYAQIVVDFLSGFTDNYVMQVYEELIPIKPIV